jgi:hypothetical protein
MMWLEGMAPLPHNKDIKEAEVHELVQWKNSQSHHNNKAEENIVQCDILHTTLL